MSDEALVVIAAEALPDRARAFVITDAETYAHAAAFLLDVKALRGQVAATFDDPIARAHALHASLCRQKKTAEAAAVEAERIVKAALVVWDTEQQQLDAARQREQDARTARQRSELEEDARHADAIGDVQLADEYRAHALSLPAAAAVAPVTPKVEGIAFRETWSARVVNFALLVKAAATHDEWVALLKPDTTALNAQARSLKTRLRIPGVEAVCAKDVAARR